MKRAVFTLWLLLAAVAATAQGHSPCPVLKKVYRKE